MTPVHNISGKVVGHIKDGVLMKRVYKSKHFMRVLNGYGMDKAIFAHDFDEVKILDKESDILYVSRREDWEEHGIRKNFGHGEQIILPLRWHEVRSRKQLALGMVNA